MGKKKERWLNEYDTTSNKLDVFYRISHSVIFFLQQNGLSPQIIYRYLDHSGVCFFSLDWAGFYFSAFE